MAFGRWANAGERDVIYEIEERAEEAFGRVDIYVSNAARRPHKDFWETTDEEWDIHLNQQLTACWHLAKAFAPEMRDAGYGQIMHVNGPDGYHAGWVRVPHSTAKGGIRIFTKSLAQGLSEFGITVNDINPGVAATERGLTTHPQFAEDGHMDEFVKKVPIRHYTQPSEIAFSCAFLASPRSAAITGSVIHLDGGLNMFS